MLHFDKHDQGIRIKLESPEVKQILAQKSTNYNKEHYKVINGYFDDQSKTIELKVFNYKD